jgi:putative flippase GtrA
LYIVSVLIMGVIDFGVTRLLITIVPFFTLHWSGAKFLSSIVGFIGNFALRKILVFPERKKGDLNA